MSGIVLARCSRSNKACPDTDAWAEKDKEKVTTDNYLLPAKLSRFQRGMYVHLINWKWRHITRDCGHNIQGERSIPYDAILPVPFHKIEKAPHLHPWARARAVEHQTRNNFRVHQHFFHMASSQAANLNLFLPILRDPRAAEILRSAKPDLATIATDYLDQGFCVEFWGGNFNSDGPERGLLGDKSTSAGTDSDIAIAYRDHEGELCLWLIEHKLVENEFTTCGGYHSSGRKTKPEYDCTRNFAQTVANKSTCYYHGHCGYRYWDLTERHAAFFPGQGEHPQCPFRGGMNQLWRNLLLALALEEQETFRKVFFSVVRHPGNLALGKSIAEFQALVSRNPKFFTFTSDTIVDAGYRYGDDQTTGWAQWYRDLYDLRTPALASVGK